MTSKEMRQRLGEIVAQSRVLNDKAHADNRAFTAEEQTSWTAMDTEITTLEADIARVDKLEARERWLGEPQKPAIKPAMDPPKPEHDREAEQRSMAFARYLGAPSEKDLKPEERSLLVTGGEGYRVPSLSSVGARRLMVDCEHRARHVRAFGRDQVSPVESDARWEERALSMATGAAGSFTVPAEEFVPELIKAVDNEAAVFALGRKFFTPQAQTLGGVALDSDPADADWTTEILTGSEDSTMDFARRELNAYPLAKLLKTSKKLLRASPLGMDGIIRDRLAYKVAMPIDAAACTGTGTSQPLGIFTASASGIPTSRDVAVDTSGAIVADKLMDARYTLRAGYQATWVLHRLILSQIRQLKVTASSDQYAWQPGLTGGVPPTLLDFPYVLDENAPSTVSTGLYVAVLGDFRYYWWNIALAMEIQRLDELYAATNQTGYIIRAELDGMPVLADAFVRCKIA
ncbi:MAG: hypothetical protein A3J75_06270 [Acidobacteria bacterium RBG_16_68_9]|nr:MAG: hypothetical protein A3J75_06270 [Acidobacteria bacterium RBG_16_68_9]